jgi:mannose-6-phosphate isomerase-like protein (cupin superfamily)
VFGEPNKWDEAVYGPISLEAVRLQFQPEARYRVSWNKYPEDTSFNGWSRAGRRYIISGSCRVSVAGQSWDLTAGDFADLPDGDFWFSVSGDSPLELISVWELPESFWQTPEDSQNAV